MMAKLEERERLSRADFRRQVRRLVASSLGESAPGTEAAGA
jgi:hypothetical protein